MLHPTSSLKRIFRSDSQSDLSPRELGALVAEVPGLPERIQRYAGQWYCWLGGNLADPVRAATVLGPKVVCQVAVQHGLIQALSRTDLPETLLAAFWSDCIRRAVAARLLAEKVEVQPDLAFTAGLGLEYGVALLLERHPRRLQWVRDVRPLIGEERVSREQSSFGNSHTSAFARVARVWELPRAVSTLVEHHHQENGVVQELVPLKPVVALADELGEAISASAAGPALEAWVAKAEEQLEIPQSEGWFLVNKVLKDAPKAAQVLGVAIGPQPTLDALRMRREMRRDPEEMSRGELVEWTRMLQEQNDVLQRRAEELQARVVVLEQRDGLTGLATHKQFLESFCEQVELSRKEGRTNLCVLMIDLDAFTDLNAQVGYDLGDTVLIKVADLLRKLLRDADHVARVGPDAFAVRLATDERGARLVAERTRASLEALRLDLGRKRIRLTASIFGVCLGDVSDTQTPEQIFAALYKLRAQGGAGGNRTYWVE